MKIIVLFVSAAVTLWLVLHPAVFLFTEMEKATSRALTMGGR